MISATLDVCTMDPECSLSTRYAIFPCEKANHNIVDGTRRTCGMDAAGEG